MALSLAPGGVEVVGTALFMAWLVQLLPPRNSNLLSRAANEGGPACVNDAFTFNTARYLIEFQVSNLRNRAVCDS